MPAFVVDKPLGLTSHDVVARGAPRCSAPGGSGTAAPSIPLATGVLVLLAEEATKLSPFLTGADKAYLAWIVFGVGTPTLDAEGPIDGPRRRRHARRGGRGGRAAARSCR